MADGPRDRAGAWDLHCHSVFSDGSETVDGLVGRAREAGLAGIAITDHDATSQLSAIRRRSRELGYPVLAGLEVSSIDHGTGRKVHILAYGVEATADGSGPLDRMCADTLFSRTSVVLWQARELARSGASVAGRTVSLDEVLAIGSASTAVYRQHIMEALTGLPPADPAYRDAYRRLFVESGLTDRAVSYPAATDAVRAIREQGGVPVLAHPGQKDSWASVSALVRAGLMGIEAFHPDHGPAEREMAFRAAREHGLFVTGGSDFHGKYGKVPELGREFVLPSEAGERVRALFEREPLLA